MAQITTVAIDKIAINPYRRLHKYPYIESKLDALMRSIEEVGLWPSIIARPVGDQRLWSHELAFGHHRLEAARRRGLKQVPLIVEKLSDKQMLQYMGRENLEDYNASFLIQLESWEAALKSDLVRSAERKQPHAIEIASLLGWTRLVHDGTPQINNTASACHSAYALIQGGYMTREDFADLTVNGARQIAERAWSRMEQIENVGAASTRPRREIEDAKRKYGRAARDTAAQVRKGAVTNREIRSRVDFNAAARTSGERPSPLFAVFANAVAENIRRTINTDADAEKLANIERVLGQLSMLEDWEALRRLKVEFINLSERALGWDKRLTPTQEKIVKFQALEGRRVDR